MQVAETSLGTLNKRLARNARAMRTPLNCLFELTPTCNLRCHFCYVALEPYKGPYLSTAAVRAVLDKLRTAGVLWLTFTGGEIFSRRDFAEIYRYARESGFLVTLYTNATMMNERLAALFRELPPFSVEVSLYGHNAEVYEKTTQIPGSFARFERGITLLQEAGVPLKLKTAMSTFTQDHFESLFTYAQARGLKYSVDTTLDYTLDGGTTPTLYRLTSRKVLDVEAEIDRVVGNGDQGPLPECSVAPPDGAPAELYRCGAGRTGLFVNALGQASHCVIDREPSFPILEMSWDELWQQMGEWVTQPLPADAPCSGCSLRGGCQSCPARSRMATGSPYLKDPYYCDVTHTRYGLPPAQHPDYRAMARPLGACAA
ncbi:MAG TPA: radical SAM protein [Gemmatimonadaceae bacterium]|nr:radical SAM protein [Gemmatimonadaceae bacterium]